ncbi:MAG: chemotaxis protein CheW [Nannocystaceae bacterium]|nr:chemotaxis protein CheW [Nannocystaceae bacterium]
MDTESQAYVDRMQLCTFKVAGRTYAVNVLDVREINLGLPLTPIPHTDPSVRGLVNIRGQVFLILDLWYPAHGTRAVVGPSSRLVLFKESVGHATGVLVDQVGDIISVNSDRLLSGRGGDSDGDAESGLPTLGVVKFETDLVVVLDPTRIIGLPKKTAPATRAVS